MNSRTLLLPLTLFCALCYFSACKPTADAPYIPEDNSMPEMTPEIIDPPVDHIHPAFDLTDSGTTHGSFIYDEFEIKVIPYSETYFATKNDIMPTPALTDDHGILIINVYGKSLVYHATALAFHAITYLDHYDRTKNAESLKTAELNAAKLMGIALAIDSCYLFPYITNYKFYEKDLLTAPWYSGIAQGVALTLFSRLYKLTGNEKYRDIADAVFRSFKRYKGVKKPWISCIDKEQHLWFEEYPHALPNHVFNGMTFAIFGVYDHYCVTKSPESKKYLQASLTTVKRNIALIRDEGKISYYCLKYDVKNHNYHPIHIKQLKILTKISGDDYFDELAQQMEADKLSATSP